MSLVIYHLNLKSISWISIIWLENADIFKNYAHITISSDNDRIIIELQNNIADISINGKSLEQFNVNKENGLLNVYYSLKDYTLI